MVKRSKRLLFAACFLMPALALAEPPETGDPISQGLWWLYHARYEKAIESFDLYTKAHPNDPAGYFYKTATNWWELAQKLDFDLPEVQKSFEANYEKTVETADGVYGSDADNITKAKALLFWGGAEGLKGRWLVLQKQWVKAYFRGKEGNKLLRQAVSLDPHLYDAYLGLGIYDYYTDTLPGIQGVLANLLIHGDRKRGLNELQLAIEKGQHSRVEAQMFLVEIYISEERTPDKAVPILEKLREEFPQSPVMHLMEATAFYHMQKWDPMMAEAQSFLERSEKEEPYYTKDGVRPARYLLGVGALFGRHDPDLAFAYMSQLLQEVDSSRWVTYAYLRRGQIYDLRGDRESALRDYRTVLSRPDFWGSRREAQIYLKKPFKA